jgi:hypothetical protein
MLMSVESPLKPQEGVDYYIDCAPSALVGKVPHNDPSSTTLDVPPPPQLLTRKLRCQSICSRL